MFENKVFGKRIPVEPEKPIINADFGSEVKDAKPNEKLFSTTSKYLFREINLFVPETIGLAFCFLIVFGLAMFGLLFSQPMFLFYGCFVPLLGWGLLWLARFLLFMPNKHRHVVHRILGTGAIRSSVDDIRKGEVPFDKNPLSEKVKILNPKKHIDFNTGKPVLFFVEGAGENVSLSEAIKGATSQQAKELNSVIDSVWGLAEAYTRYNLKKAEQNKELLLFIMIAISILVSLVIAYFTMNGNSMLEQILKFVTPAAKAVVATTTGGA